MRFKRIAKKMDLELWTPSKRHVRKLVNAGVTIESQLRAVKAFLQTGSTHHESCPKRDSGPCECGLDAVRRFLGMPNLISVVSKSKAPRCSSCRVPFAEGMPIGRCVECEKALRRMRSIRVHNKNKAKRISA